MSFATTLPSKPENDSGKNWHYCVRDVAQLYHLVVTMLVNILVNPLPFKKCLAELEIVYSLKGAGTQMIQDYLMNLMARGVKQFNTELHIIENSKRVLTDVCHMGWEKLKELTNVFCRLEREIQNKEETLALECRVKDLDRNSSGISYKRTPTRIPAESMTEESYVHCINNTVQIAEQLMKESKALRETMFKSREQARNQMYAQAQQVEMIIRRRVYDIQRARNEMEWQKHKLEENLRKVDKEIESLRAAVADKINPTKLVETRLETRKQRPVLERVQDKPMRGLIEEYERVHLSSSNLEKKLEEALATYHGMYRHYQRVTKDLEYKNQASETDRRLMEIRKPLHVPDESQFQRNVGYCHMADELVTD